MRLLLSAAALLLLLGIPTSADDSPVVYTGCLHVSNGSPDHAHVADAPMQPCRDNDEEIPWEKAGVSVRPGRTLRLTEGSDGAFAVRHLL
jgi:hypothetical protein